MRDTCPVCQSRFAEKPITVGELTLLPTDRIISYKGKETQLEKLLVTVLKIMMLRPDRVITNSQFDTVLYHIENYKESEREYSLTNLASSGIRKKFKLIGCPYKIVCVYNAGYKLVTKENSL